MKVGLHIGKFHRSDNASNIGPSLSEIAKAADNAGFYSLWLMDHLFQLGEHYGDVHGPAEESMLEAYTTLGYMAARTKQIKLGTLVTCEFFRPPGLLIKAITTLDVLTGGRTYFGIGAGWYEREAIGLGISMPQTWGERFERLEETLQIAQQMWTSDRSPFNGHHHKLKEPINSPPPLSDPHPSILIGGSGERKTLRLVAQYADASNFVLPSPLAHPSFGRLAAQDSYNEWLEQSKNWSVNKLDILREHCETVQRPFEEIEKTVVTYILVGGDDGLSTSEVIKLINDLGSMGYDHVIFNIHNVDTIKPLEIIGSEVIPVISD